MSYTFMYGVSNCFVDFLVVWAFMYMQQCNTMSSDEDLVVFIDLNFYSSSSSVY